MLAMGARGGAVAALNTCPSRADLEALKLQDPAVAIRTELGFRLNRRFSLQPPPPMTNADLVLEIATTHWAIEATGIAEYGLKYEGRIKLIDRRRDVVLAHGICKASPPIAGNPLDCNDLVTNYRVELNESIRETAHYCGEDYRTRLLGLY
ncbi:MAG TPA: hypothetical protein VHU40_01605 [Polyangia bacterium]|nr:hypothetical protein [Polyangia bacterium]